MNRTEETQFFRCASSWLACRLVVMGGQIEGQEDHPKLPPYKVLEGYLQGMVDNATGDETAFDLQQSSATGYPPLLRRVDPMALWEHTKDGDPRGLELFRRHYSYNSKRDQLKFPFAQWSSDALFVGPGEKLVLMTADALALFVWRKEKFRLDKQVGVNNAVFRNEGSAAGRASELIAAANEAAWERWPGERLFTFVDPSKVRHKRDPGRCFLRAGYRACGETATGLLIFECLPAK